MTFKLVSLLMIVLAVTFLLVARLRLLILFFAAKERIDPGGVALGYLAFCRGHGSR